jgi:DNA-directed RNA polymerase subunit RPC12/RpoP
MYRLNPSRPLAALSADFPALVDCPHCQSRQPMNVIGLYPMLYCGKDAVLYQCTKCGSEKTENMESPALGGGRI